jgi:outer membrane protein OmpA-like peptidoglycan-associated protein
VKSWTAPASSPIFSKEIIMNLFKLTPAMLAVTLLAAACGTAPTKPSLLEQARSNYIAAQSSPSVTRYAPLELQQAGEALQLANTAAQNHSNNESIDKLAYVANQKIALAQEVTKQKTAEAEVGQASIVRDKVLLDQRTSEADRAKFDAQQSLLAAQVAQNAAADAKLNAQIAQDATVDAQRKAQLSQDATVNAQRQAQASQNATVDAQQQTLDAQAHAAALEAQLSDLAAKKTERGTVITLGDVLFGTDLARLNADGMRTAQKLALVLQQNPQRTVLVEGFTDSTGTALHNQELSERRAESVRIALLEQGISAERINIQGFGESYPVAANDSAANRQLNRRVEIILSDDGGKVVAR